MNLPTNDRWERYGWQYDVAMAGRFRPGEELFYAALARTFGGPTLEPACGSGRMLAPLRAAGLEVWGSDTSVTMLRLAAQHLKPLGGAHLRQQALQELDLPERFGLILLPLDAFRLLRNEAEQQAFLAAAARHLRPRGRLALDVTLPTADLPTALLGEPLTLPDGGHLQATARWVLTAHETIEETVFTTTTTAGQRSSETCRDAYQVVTAAGLRRLFQACGWRIEQESADFSGTPFDDRDGRLVLVAAPGGAAAKRSNRPPP